jgi:ERI1 exoribonuclease 3
MTGYICILDFEATCWDNSRDHEIIEFPSVLLKWNDDNEITIVDEFQIFVKPKKYPVVSEFCRKLTGITQEIVNKGTDLRSAIKSHASWLNKHANQSNITIVTCGRWDLKIMLPADLKHIAMTPDKIYMRFINLKDIFEEVVQCGQAGSMVSMLNHFNLELLGHHHSGIDDCRNMVRIFTQLVANRLTKDKFLNSLQYVDYKK